MKFINKQIGKNNQNKYLVKHYVNAYITIKCNINLIDNEFQLEII